MNIAKHFEPKRQERQPKHHQLILTNDCAGRVALGIFLLVGSIASSLAGYTIISHVDTAAGTNTYNWMVYNQDQSWGLDGFAIEVPLQTRVLARTIPPPYSNPDRTAYWIMEERYDVSVDPHDGRANVPAPRPGKKWLVWWGQESPSVYPPGTTVTFTLTTDSSLQPGAVRGSAVTYTPQNNPHYYVTWHGEIVGPGAGVADTLPGNSSRTNLQTLVAGVYSILGTNLYGGVANDQGSVAVTPAAVSITLHAGITIEGVPGLAYGIQYNRDLTSNNGWLGLANVILTTPKQIWYDPQPAAQPQRYYRILPGPISIP